VIKTEWQITLKKIRCLAVVLFFAVQGYGDTADSAEYRIGGVNPEALLCRPEGKGPFPAVVHNHGVGVDIQGYHKAVRRGYNLPGICKELASAGFLTFVPIRQGGPGLHTIQSHKAQVLQAIDHVKSLPDVDPSRIAVTGNSRGAVLTLMAGVEHPGLEVLVVMAPADVGPTFAGTLPRIASIEASVLILVEASDTSEIQNNFDTLDRVLRENKKEVKSIRYDRGGGHNLFHTTGYYLQDIKAFLREKLDAQ
jgi:dienelactone hydrolase